jgi:hypothetical protein
MPSDQPLQFPTREETLAAISESLARFHLASCQMREATWRSFSVISESRELLARASEDCMAGMKKEEARRAALSEYDGWAKKHPNDAMMMGGFLFYRHLQNLPTLTERKVGPARFPCGWRRQVANRSRLATGSVGRLGSRIRRMYCAQRVLCTVVLRRARGINFPAQA